MGESNIPEPFKLWQEQDRINRELIPRVIKVHKLLCKHIASHEDGDSLARAQIRNLEGRVSDQDRINRDIDTKFTENHESTARLVELHEEGDTLTRAQINVLKNGIGKLQRDLRRYHHWVPYLGLTVAVVALIVAFVA